MEKPTLPSRPTLLLMTAGLVVGLITISQMPFAQSAPGTAKLKARKEKLKNEITLLISDKQCNADKDCASLALGAKSCGGPSEYLVYSKLNSKMTAVHRKASEVASLDRQINEADQMMSDCSEQPTPLPKCVSNVCVDSLTPRE